MKKKLSGKVTSVGNVIGLWLEKKPGVLTLSQDSHSENDLQQKETEINHLIPKMVNTLPLQRAKRARGGKRSRTVATLSWMLHGMDSKKRA